MIGQAVKTLEVYSLGLKDVSFKPRLSQPSPTDQEPFVSHQLPTDLRIPALSNACKTRCFNVLSAAKEVKEIDGS